MRLGPNQRGVLKALAEGGPYPGAWYYGNHSTTVRVLDTLVVKGLAAREERQRGISLHGGIPRIASTYRITDRGREILEGARSS